MFCQPQPQQMNAEAPFPLFGSPGISAFAAIGTGPIRGFYFLNGQAYLISGTQFYSLNADGSSAVIGGGFQNGNNPLAMADNGTQIQIVDSVNGFIYDTSTATFSQIASPNFYACNTTQFFDTYFVNDRKNTNQFFISNSNDGLTYDALDFASAESSSDYVLASVNNLQQLFIPGGLTVELWYDQGGSGFPLARYSGAAVQRGFAGPFAWAKEDQAIFFIGDDRRFYRLQGAYPIAISTFAIAEAWKAYGDISDAFVFVINWGEHKWVVVQFPSVPATWVFDAITGLWHERESWDENNMSLGRWRVNCHIFAYNQHFVGDGLSNKIGVLDDTVYTEWGNTIRGLATSPPIHADRHRMFFGLLELMVEAGVGLTLGQGSDPQLMMERSVDGGRTFQSPQLWRSMGKIGEYRQRLRWPRMGSARQLILRVTVTDPVKRTIISAHLQNSRVGTG